MKHLSILLLLGLVLLTKPVTLYAAPGDLDPTFGNEGIVITDFVGGESGFANGGDLANAVALQADGKIVAAGVTFDLQLANADNVALARYNTDGSLDSDFGSGGMVQGNNDVGSVRDLALQQDGKIVVLGRGVLPARYNPDGSLDMSFGSNGITPTNVGSGTEFSALVLQADGKFVLAGSSHRSSSDHRKWFTLARYNPDGSLDTSFGSGGIVKTAIGNESFAKNVAVQADGKIVVAGSSFSSSDSPRTAALARYDADGSLDTTFGNGGITTTDLGDPITHTGSSRIHAVVLQADNKIIAVGVAQENIEIPPSFALVRYNADGSLDTSFGNGGVVRTNIDDILLISSANAAVLQADGGKLVVAGHAHFGNGNESSDFALARYESVAVCGDGQVSRGIEQYDDGGTTAGDGCDEQCVFEERSVTETVSAGTPVTTDTSSQGATPSQPVQAAVTPSVDGTVTVTTSGDISTAPDGFQILTGITHITAPDGTAANPLILVFRLDESILPIREDPLTIQITKDGVIVPSCQGVLGVADPDPCAIREVLSGCSAPLTSGCCTSVE